ncbi:F-box/LRR-repeat protein [Trifolium pratense]|uniref:F-box/LRR-repeat protein n=1 Tax=Trifolium pratense TaxID=57577 RepID=A0A2K3N875_TRIPR|nr:F-box/LRR-repeat protein [Trifolium pratense]
MDTVIFSPNSHHLPLKSFQLTCRFRDGLSDYYTFDQWIKAAKQRRVKLLDLDLSNVPLAPSTIFCCKTLVNLRLTSVSVAEFPRCSVDLPLLKYLYLDNVRFHDMDNLIRLIYECPMLEFLRISNIEFEVESGDGVTAGGYLKPLSKLIRANTHSLLLPLRVFCNVQYLHIIDFKV